MSKIISENLPLKSPHRALTYQSAKKYGTPYLILTMRIAIYEYSSDYR